MIPAPDCWTIERWANYCAYAALVLYLVGMVLERARVTARNAATFERRMHEGTEHGGESIR